MRNFAKHKYKVQCKCGYSKKLNDDNFRDEIVLVKFSHCPRCCPRCEGRANELYYDKKGNRVY